MAPSEHRRRVCEAPFSPDWCYVVTVRESKTMGIWDTATGQAVSPPLRHHDIIVRAEFMADGHRIVTLCRDGTVRFWEVAPTTLPMNDLVSAAEFLAGRRIHKGMGLVQLSQNEMAALWLRLSEKNLREPSSDTMIR